MLYDPYGDSEDGRIVLHPESKNLGHDITIIEWSNCPHGVQLVQGDDVIVIDAEQLEALYQIIKHNR